MAKLGNTETTIQPPPGIDVNGFEGVANNINDIFASVSKDLEPLDILRSGKSILQVPDTGTSQYWWILEHFWCTSIAWKCDIYVLKRAGVIQKLTILEHKNGLVLANTRVPVSGTWSILFLRSFRQISLTPNHALLWKSLRYFRC